MAPPEDLAALAIDDFIPHLNGTFNLRNGEELVALRLVRVDRAGESGRAGGAFSLLFATAKGAWLQQAIYPVEHRAFGTIEIFLVPIGPLQDGNGYQAIFT